MKAIKGHSVFLFLAIVTIFYSCDQNQVYERNIEINNLSWHKDTIIKFQVDIKDTINPHNIYVNVRDTSRYQLQNLHLIITTTSPNKSSMKNDLNVI